MAICLVTGATGYIGSKLTRLLLQQDHNVIAIVRETSSLFQLPSHHPSLHIENCSLNYESLPTIFKKYDVDVVFHLAAPQTSTDSYEEIKNSINTTITFGTYLLEAMSNSSCKLLINTGSFFETGESNQYNPQSFYAASKSCFQQIISYYVKTKKIKAISLRLMDSYGPRDPRAKLWPQLISSLKSNKKLCLSQGEQILNLVHVDDICEAFVNAWKILLTESYTHHEVYYVATEKKQSLRCIVEIFEQAAGRKLLIEWGARPYRETEIMNPYVGELLPNWHAKIELMQGFRSLLESENGV